jgi:hypothetical protein
MKQTNNKIRHYELNVNLTLLVAPCIVTKLFIYKLVQQFALYNDFKRFS